MQPQQPWEEEQVEYIIRKFYKRKSNSLQIHCNKSASVLRKVFQLIDCQTLRKIELCSMQMEDQLVDVIMEFQFTAMECIIIDSNSIGEDGVKKLLSREWPALKKIFLRNSKIGDQGLATLLSRTPKQVEELILKKDEFTEIRLIYFLQTVNLENIKKLSLSQNNLGQNVKYLTKGNLPQLQSLELSKCSLTDESIKKLTKGWWLNMSELVIEQNEGVSPKSLAQLEGVNWKLNRFVKFFNPTLSIYYFYAIVRPENEQRQLGIYGYGVCKDLKQILSNANVKI